MNDTIRELQTALTEFREYAPETGAVATMAHRAPTLRLLKTYRSEAQVSILEPDVLEIKLAEFGFEGKVVNVRKGPLITRYEVKLAGGIRLSQIRNIAEDLAIALMSDKVRIQAPIPGTSMVGIEVLNETPAIIGLKEVLKKAKKSKYELPMALGTDTTGEPVVLDLAKMPHLLVAGQTGSGKSVGLNALILTLLYTKTPEECQLILVDPKRVEMVSYSGLPHLRQPVVMEPEDATAMFHNLVREMERRYETLSEHKVRNIVSYNKLKDVERMPYIVTVVDEMADLMMTSGKALESYIVRLAQLARAVGIHLVLATQKPVVKVITGLIKSNMPSRIAFQVASKSDSRVILDGNGAEKLAGRGDMLATYPGVSEPVRLHGAWVSDEEIADVTDFLKGED
jgi:S-DNA-T family DNA segregation ATPase FtsK/SpoIIIE